MEHDLSSGAMWYGAFVFSTVCHEAAHSWVAFRLGDDTASRGGQVTLNPVPHVRREPMGMVVVPIASWLLGGWMIGWASAPYNLAWSRKHPKSAALMAVAGPAANLTLAIAAALLIRLGYEWGVFGVPFVGGMASGMPQLALGIGGGAAMVAARVLSILLALNLLLLVFNLIPLPPLDGSQVPLLFLPPAAAEKYAHAMRSPILRYVGILVAWRFLPSILPPLVQAFVHVLYA